MINTGQSLNELKSCMQKLPQIMINVKTDNAAAIVNNEQLQKAKKTADEKLAGRGRILLRPSGTEPLLRVMVEGEEVAQVQTIANELADMVKSINQP